ncbi:acyltransferase [Arthrobacter sp. KN11-1C]|uniref:acyltransferase n=1 Tax=Arthrobacter sp. KN11-1C TaxID=3445774 RepID=UPI003FA002B0
MIIWLREKLKLRRTLTRNVAVGSDFRVGLNSFVWAPRKLRIGNSVHLGSNVRVEVDGVIGDSVLIANSAGIVGRDDHAATDVGIPIPDAEWVGRFPERLSRPVSIGSDVWIGYGAIVLSGVSIGNSAVIGAGAVVTKDVPENSIVVGNPGRVIGTRFETKVFEEHWRILSQSGIRRITGDIGDE